MAACDAEDAKMQISLVAADATEIRADVQCVKHFDGRLGGSEAALNRELGGALGPILDDMEEEAAPCSRLIRADTDGIKSKRLLLLGLGKLDDFGLNDLRRGIQHATHVALEHGFTTVATPVIGISEQVGLPAERAFKALIRGFVRAVLEWVPASPSQPTIEHLIVFDADPSKAGFFKDSLPGLLTELGLDHKPIGASRFDVNVDSSGSTVDTERDSESLPKDALASKSAHSSSDANLACILFLSANPTDTPRLRLDEEIRTIDEAINASKSRDVFDLRQATAVRIRDLEGHLLRYTPTIAHFSAHSGNDGALLLEDVLGKYQPVDPSSLAALFEVFSHEIRCVVLNSCYSEPQAEAIAQHIDCVVGTSSAIVDDSAIRFSAAFYQALAYGRNIGHAFALGQVAIGLEKLPGADALRLIMRQGVNAADVRFA
jgi:hypothetical protein